MSREGDFLRFCSKALGTGKNSPLRISMEDGPVNGATISALVEAFKECHPIYKPGPQAQTVQGFDDPMWDLPWACYQIRNQATGASYIGIAKHGFRTRYPKCEWWRDHDNARLMQDAQTYGLVNFKVLLYVCLDERDMKRQEAELLRANRLTTYNIRPQADNV